MSDSDEASSDLPQATASAGASATQRQMRLTTSQNIGYCHVCDKQVEIDQDHFSCSECHGGFVELFELDNAPAATEASPEGIRLTTAQGGGAGLLPLLLSQMLNQQVAQAANASASPTRASMTIQRRPMSASQPPSRQTSESGTPTPGSAGPGRHGQTRVQLIVPGEQFDLYGIINTVLQDILDPTRQQPNAQIHFHQAPPMRMFQLHGDLRDYAWGASGLDTIITQLLNQLENTGPPPASDTQLQNLPEITISQEDVDKNMQCSICMDDFALNDKAKRLPCKHLFHEPCIVEWLKLHGTCPVCRKNLVGEDTSQHEYIRPPDAPGAAGQADGGGGEQASASAAPPATPQPTPSQQQQQQQSPAADPNSQRRNPNSSGDGNQPVYDMDFD